MSRRRTQHAMRSHGWRARSAALVVAGMTALVAVGCGGGGDEAPLPAIAEGQVPSYYPPDYSQLIEGSKSEGPLTIYGNTDQENWAPIVRDFQRKYPWLKTVATNNLDSDELFQRALSENATGGTSADILVSSAIGAWVSYADRPGNVLDYKSPEAGHLPPFATLMPGVYAMSTEAMAVAYNATLLSEDEYPTTLRKLAEDVSADPDKYRGKITTRDVNGSFGFAGAYGVVQARPDSWTQLGTILPMARPETSSGTQLEKVQTGEYLVGFFVSSGNGYNAAKKSGGLLKVGYLTDGTPVLPRGIGINPKTKNPNSAKLFLDFVLSREGQQSLLEGGGLTAVRQDVDAGEDGYTYQKLVDTLGEPNVLLLPYRKIDPADSKAFQTRWNDLLDND